MLAQSLQYAVVAAFSMGEDSQIPTTFEVRNEIHCLNGRTSANQPHDWNFNSSLRLYGKIVFLYSLNGFTRGDEILDSFLVFGRAQVSGQRVSWPVVHGLWYGNQVSLVAEQDGPETGEPVVRADIVDQCISSRAVKQVLPEDVGNPSLAPGTSNTATKSTHLQFI